jgi:hypothetical protein
MGDSAAGILKKILERTEYSMSNRNSKHRRQAKSIHNQHILLLPVRRGLSSGISSVLCGNSPNFTKIRLINA